MGTINQVKQSAEADTPLLLFRCVMPSGDVECWSTHSISFNGDAYAARVLKHDLFDLQLAAGDAMDGVSQLTLTLANADLMMSELNRAIGFKGAQLTVYFVFADLPSSTITTESVVLFNGIGGDPDLITEDLCRLSFINKLALQRIPIPDVRVQRTCPWSFPATLAQRTEAVNGGTNGRFSRFYRCGYSADVTGGCGNLNGTSAFVTCDGTRTQCEQRGMFSTDSKGNATRRFGGFEFVPSAIMVRTSGSKTSHLSPVLDNAAKYNDAVPVVYGTGWLKAPVILARNDGNLTHIEALLGMGVIQGTLKVVVNDVEIAQGVAGKDMTATGWFSVVTAGARTGNFNLDFTDSSGNPLGDPYGSVSVLSIVVPNRICSGTSTPTVEVLLQGMKVDLFNSDGSFQQTTFTNNPAWVILDILRRSGWAISDLNLPTFATAAQFCDTLISTTDLNGNAISVPRYECNLVLTTRQSAASVIRGIRVASSLMLRYGLSGLLELLPETSISLQQPTLPDGGNSVEPLNGGWPTYEFSDSSGPFSGIVRQTNGASSLSLSSRSLSETSNRLSVEFQDSSNEYQQNSLSIVDAGDSGLIGYEISSQSTALGISNTSQATRVLLRQLDMSTNGNTFVQFQTSFRALKVRPGDIIGVTYLKEGLERAPFRVIKLSPSENYELVTIVAQIHNDNWYSDNPAVLAGAGRQPSAQVLSPRPLIGLVPHLSSNGVLEYYDFQITEDIQAQNDGSATDTLTVRFSVPTTPSSNSLALPLLSLSPQFSSSGGSLPGGTSFYYGVSAVDAAGYEGNLSFTVPAVIPAGTDTNTVILTGLSFPKSASGFNVYRGASPATFYRIASNVALATTFTDTGSPAQPVGPPDASFDHANFYYRIENAGPFTATAFSATTIVCDDMGATPLAYSGMLVRIIEGTGQYQERAIATNDQRTLTVTPAWTTVPDLTSVFVISEASWRFAAVSNSSPSQFEIPYRSGSVVQVTGRGANVNNLEGSIDLCPLTRFALGGGQPDVGTPEAPSFSLTAPGAGDLSLSQISFSNLTNSSSIRSGTLQISAWNELLQPGAVLLAAALDSASSTFAVTSLTSIAPGSIIQIDSELMAVISASAQNNRLTVLRSALGSQASPHVAGAAVLPLQTSTIVVPFAQNFFANRASQNFIHKVHFPDLRICAAQFFVTNSFGDSQASQQCFTTLTDGGLRTLSGGQFSLQVNGLVTAQQNASPPFLAAASHAVRDVRASLNQAPAGYSIGIQLLQNGSLWATLTIASGSATSNVVDGVTLPALVSEGTVTMNVSLSTKPNYSGPLFPGKDLTVTIRF